MHCSLNLQFKAKKLLSTVQQCISASAKYQFHFMSDSLAGTLLRNNWEFNSRGRLFGKGTGANGLVPETKINKKLNNKKQRFGIHVG